MGEKLFTIEKNNWSVVDWLILAIPWGKKSYEEVIAPSGDCFGLAGDGLLTRVISCENTLRPPLSVECLSGSGWFLVIQRMIIYYYDIPFYELRNAMRRGLRKL